MSNELQQFENENSKKNELMNIFDMSIRSK